MTLGLGPEEVLESTEVGVLAAGEQAVEVLGEDREVALGIVDPGMRVVGHGLGEEDLDL